MTILAPRQREMAVRAAQLFEAGFVVIDFETTGFPSDPETRIVEVAVIDHRGRTLLNTLINPERHIPSGASRVHGITDRHVKNAPTFSAVYAELSPLLDERRAVAYNHSFERGMMALVCGQHALPAPAADWRCAMRAYQGFRGLRNFTSLTNACTTEGITIADAHRAMGDCKMTLALMYIMASAAT